MNIRFSSAIPTRRVRSHKLAGVAAGFAWLVLSCGAFAADGDLDPSFDPGAGVTANTAVVGMAVQPDGKIIIVGNFSTYRGTSRVGIARLNPDGTLDATFDPGAGADRRVISVALQSDGKIVILGAFSNYNGVRRKRIARLNADGSLDTSFDPGDGPDDSATGIPPHALLIQPDGKIIIAGDFDSYDGIPTARNVTRLNSDGTPDTSFETGAGATETIYALALAPDGKIYIGGLFQQYNGISRSYLARLQTNGTLDTTFNPGTEIEGEVRTIAVQPDGKVFAGGYGGLIRFNTDGSTDQTFAKDEFPVVFASLIRPDGKIVIGGNFQDYNGAAAVNVARLSASGVLDTSFTSKPGPNASAFALAAQADGKILVGGSFTSYHGVARGGIARLLSSGGGTPTPTPTPTATPRPTATPTPTPSGTPRLPKKTIGSTFFGSEKFGEVMRFRAAVFSNSDLPAGLKLRVQFSTTSSPSGDWQDLPNGSAGRMIRDYSDPARLYVLNSTNYPLRSPVYFRAIASAPGFPDSISDASEAYDLNSAFLRAGPAVLASPNTVVPTNYLMSFRATVENDAPGVAVRLQSSRTPGDESSWADFPDPSAGAMSQTTPGNYNRSTNNYPTGDSLYFRAIVSRPGFVDGLSNIIGDFDLKRVAPPTVTITSPAPQPGGGSGRSVDDPIAITTDDFNFSVNVSTSDGDRVRVLRLFVDEGTLHRVEGASTATVQLRIGEAGYHRLRAFVAGENSGTAAAVLHVQVAPSGGKVFRCQGGGWTSESTWRDEQGRPGVPGPRDLAVIGTANVFLPSPVGNVRVGAVTLNGGSIDGPAGLTIVEGLTISSGELRNLSVTIEPKAELRLIGDTAVRWSGRLTNKGKFVVDGAGGITGVPNSAGGTSFLLVQNDGQALFGGGAFLDFAEGSTGLGTFQPLKLLGNDGSSLLANDGASLINQDGSGLISQDCCSLIGPQGSSLVSDNGLGILADGGSQLISNLGATVAFRPAGAAGAAIASGRDAGEAAEASGGYTQEGGVIDLGSSPILENNLQIVGGLTINGGVVKGTGVIFGDVTQNSGFISPGSSAGAIGIDGNFTQGTGGVMIAEIGGANPAQFDQLLVTGTANVNGQLTVRAIDGYVPDADGTFSPLAYSAGSGSLTTSGNVQMTLEATGLLGTLDANVAPPPAPKLLNISTRMRVERGDNALIGGFIVTGTSAKRVIIRALGPSLPVAGALANPTLQLNRPDGSTVFNDDWKENQAEVEATTIPPPNDREAAIVATLEPGFYSAVVRGIVDGQPNGTGVGLVEAYDLDAAVPSTLANISTRGFVQTGDDVMIGGVIVGGTEPAKVLVRAIGPSLTEQGVAEALQDPELELVDKNGNIISNDDWRATQEAEIIATTVPPSDSREAAIVATLVPDFYTAIVRGKDGTTGVALVEGYNLQ